MATSKIEQLKKAKEGAGMKQTARQDQENTVDREAMTHHNFAFPKYWQSLYNKVRKQKGLPVWSQYMRQAIAEKLQRDGFDL
jgi:hypothetical protein